MQDGMGGGKALLQAILTPAVWYLASLNLVEQRVLGGLHLSTSPVFPCEIATASNRHTTEYATRLLLLLLPSAAQFGLQHVSSIVKERKSDEQQASPYYR